MSKSTTRRRVIAAESSAAAFLLPPFESPAERQDAKSEALGLVLQAIESLVRAGRDDLAFKAQALAQQIEAAE